MRKIIASLVVVAGIAGTATACSSGITATPKAVAEGKLPPVATAPAPATTPAQASRYTSCLVILARVHAVITADWANSGPDGGPADASQATGQTADGTQVDCYMSYEPAEPGSPQTVWGNGWHVDVFGATPPAAIAAKLGEGKVIG